MKASVAIIAVLVWSVLLGCAAFAFGYHMRDARQATKETQTLRTQVVAKSRQDRRALGAGVRAEQATAVADQAFQTIRSDYEADLRKNPDAGCVLDPDSLRGWNAANAESDRDAPGEAADGVPAAAEGESGTERRHEPH